MKWVVFIVVGLLLSSFISANAEGLARFNRPAFKLLYVISIILNIALLLTLLIIYLNSYLKTKSSFTLGLVFFIGVLFVQKIMIFFYPFVPHLFETLALAILLVLSVK